MAINFTQTQLKKLPKLAEGGEAAIYEHGHDVIKIFHPTSRIDDKEKKVEALLRHKLRAKGLVLPTDTVTVNGKFAGYAMPCVKNANPLHDFTKARFVKAENLDNKSTLEIVTAIGKTLDKLHGGGVVIGDVSDNNFMATIKSPHAVYFIDLDSWGISGLPPDAFTETFVPPESYGKKQMSLNEQTDCFGYAILAFNVLTRLHPFNGTYTKNDRMSVAERIKNQLSVLGSAKGDIIVNKAIPSWQWMSPDLIDGFLSVFEKGERRNIASLIEDQLKHSKKCKVHDVWYYDKFADCPLCSGQAKIIAIPVPTKVAPSGSKQPQIVVLFEAGDVRLMIDVKTYIAQDGQVVYHPTGKRVDRGTGRIHFTAGKPGDRYVLRVGRRNVAITDTEGNNSGQFRRAYDSSYVVSGAKVFYVDESDVVRQLQLTSVGISDSVIAQSNNPLLAANGRGEIFVLARYRDRLMASYDGRNTEVMTDDKVTEYTIKYDEKTATWLFIYEKPNGRHRTMVFGPDGVEFDSEMFQYNATPLSNVCYQAGTVYGPGNSEVIGVNLKKNTTRTFACSVVDANSALSFENGGFVIVTDDKVYRFGG
ncbi:MAG: hypothetical protein LBK50_03675 [Candidatus Nomurabacteria bacterium]|nr:hypothetical protein [Candidatus Nomurabacteria bacterium]